MKIFVLLISLLLLPYAKAVCPLCTIAVGAGLGLFRYMGIDDLITSIWIGGLLISMSFWTIDWLEKKKIKFIFRDQIVFLSFYLLVIIPFYLGQIIGHPLNTFFGIDKIIFGMFVGTVAFLKSIYFDRYLRKINQNKVLFPYQKVILPLLFLLIASISFYLILGILG
ncbi:MAG: hypothetical protein N3D75_02925 [Candidatus Aenigmarchaeota archaeon]|nr:hypothetical protein [Candidatus Aenigmarchaeota archaeon]